LKYAVINLPCSGDSLHYSSSLATSFRHPVYAWLGIRPVVAQHTAEEHAALERMAANRGSVVEIGVAEGVSAMALLQNIEANGTLYLIDPFHLNRISALNFTKRAAHRAVEHCPRGKVVWIENFSFNAVGKWKTPIDLLLIDGDHSEKGVRQDWEDWSRFVVPGGAVIFHDARLFEGGWTNQDYGPVKLVDDLFRQQMIPGWEIVEEIHSLVVVKRCA
jgi:predicted O-methyltransferase YrrM